MNPQWKKEFFERVINARSSAGYSKTSIAEAMGIPTDTYSKYEIRSVMPMDLLEKFTSITGITIDHLVTGRTHTPINELHVAEEPATYNTGPSPNDTLSLGRIFHRMLMPLDGTLKRAILTELWGAAIAQRITRQTDTYSTPSSTTIANVRKQQSIVK